MQKKENRAFNEMYIAAKKRLEGKNPVEIAQNAGVEFDEQTLILKVKSLDSIFELEYPTYDMKEKRNDWQILTMLHYLDLADKTADHYLTIEDAVGVGEIMIKILNDRYNKLYCEK